MATQVRLLSIDDIRNAASAIDGAVLRTPLLACPWALGGDSLWVKPENLQATGSFKVRGAFNAVRTLSASLRQKGLVTYSSGNHAQAVAYAARRFQIPCTVVMPEDAQAVKVAATRELGAKIVFVRPAERKQRAEELSVEFGYSLIPPYDHIDVMAGQGTVGMEIIHDLPAARVVLVPIGGGALAGGVAAAIKSFEPSATVVGVEPELAADAEESLRKGNLVAWPMSLTGRTVADGLRTNLSDLTFAHLAHYLDSVITVSDSEILAAVGELARSGHLVAEPSGAVSLAAYLYHRDRLPGGPTVAVISGGNVDPEALARAITNDNKSAAD